MQATYLIVTILITLLMMMTTMVMVGRKSLKQKRSPPLACQLGSKERVRTEEGRDRL